MSNNEALTSQKKGRKRKNAVVHQQGDVLITSENEVSPSISVNTNTFFSTPEATIHIPTRTTVQDVKKRGRKPKGGKLVVKNAVLEDSSGAIPNIILHLKCSLKDLDVYKQKHNKMISETLNYDPDIPPDIMTYNISEQKTNGLPYSSIDSASPISIAAPISNNRDIGLPDIRDVAYIERNSITQSYMCSKCNSYEEKDAQNSGSGQKEDSYHEVSNKNIANKLKRLKIDLYKNSLLDKKSACFWCTYEYDSQVCFIPKYEIDGSICGYGSFCRPECAVAFLMKEGIDDSTKFERYHLLNQIYSKVNDFKTNVKPAPDPHYLLDKFYGNLTIQEYRKLLNTDHIMLVIDKPLTRILPELHEDTDDFIIGIYGGTKGQGSTQAGGVYKVKRQSEKQAGQTKNNIMKENFGIQQ